MNNVQMILKIWKLNSNLFATKSFKELTPIYQFTLLDSRKKRNLKSGVLKSFLLFDGIT